MHNLNKLPLRVLICTINHCCQSIIPSNTNSGFSPWHYFASVTAKVRWSQDFMQKKPWKESFLALLYEEFPAKISVSWAFLEPSIPLYAKTPKTSVSLVAATFTMLPLLYQSQVPNCPENSNNHHLLANTLNNNMVSKTKCIYWFNYKILIGLQRITSKC